MHLGYSASEATSLNAAFSILCYLFPILGGWMADAFLGRYKTILLFASIYVVGVFLAAGSAYPTFDNEVYGAAYGLVVH
jgi:dipeptide/tripeptide permease